MSSHCHWPQKAAWYEVRMSTIPASTWETEAGGVTLALGLPVLHSEFQSI